MTAPVESTIRGEDGAELRIRSLGSGPGVVVIHGGGVTASDYRRLATALAPDFTVHLYDRRGHAAAPPLDPQWDLSVEVADLRAITAATGATRLFGHSGGGVIALLAAVAFPLDAIAVFDPALSINGLFPFDFLVPFDQAMTDGDVTTAITHMGRGINTNAVPLPFGVQKAIVKGFIRTPVGKKMVDLLPTTARQMHAFAAAGGPAAAYSSVQARALLTCGTRSADYYVPICDRLAAAMPHARSLRVPGSHNAANIARPDFVRPFAEFFAAAG